MLAHDDLHLPVPIQVRDGDGMRRTDSIDDMQVEFPVAQAAGILEPAHGREKRLADVVIPIYVFDGEENIGAPIAVHIRNRDAADHPEICGLQMFRVNQQMGLEPAVAQIVQPGGSGHDIELSVSVQVLGDHLFAIGDVGNDAFGPGMLFGIIRDLKDLWWTVLTLVIPAD